MKQERTHAAIPTVDVVPLAGTWIETIDYLADDDNTDVVPLAGTWIETAVREPEESCGTSFPLRERGLKPSTIIFLGALYRVVPLAGTWIET